MPRRGLHQKKKRDRDPQPALAAVRTEWSPLGSHRQPTTRTIRGWPCSLPPTGPIDEATDRLKNLLAFEEGKIVNKAGLHVAYKDSKGIWTIGYGFNLQDSSAPGVLRRVTTKSTTALIAKTETLTEREAQALLLIAEGIALKGVRGYFPDFSAIEMPRRVVLGAMVYQFGAGRFGKFRRLIPAVKVRDWPTVVTSMQQSQWYRSDSPLRARRMVVAVRTNTFPASAIQTPGGAPVAPAEAGLAALDVPSAPVSAGGPKGQRSPWPFDNP